jgi:hypothetical protein
MPTRRAAREDAPSFIEAMTKDRPSLSLWSSVAVGLHVALVVALGLAPRAEARTAQVLEVEFIEMELPAPAVSEVARPEEPKTDVSAIAPERPRFTPPMRALAAPAAPAAPPAAAPQLITADEALNPNTPLDFASGPNGTMFTGGIVAVGGTSALGASGTRASEKPSASSSVANPPPSNAVVSSRDLSRSPGLAEPDPCRGRFPVGATANSARVVVSVVVGPDGRASSASVVSEDPPSEGFGAAARACLLDQRFSPGLARDGRAVTAGARVRVQFAR